jgi:Lhr-like helicase
LRRRGWASVTDVFFGSSSRWTAARDVRIRAKRAGRHSSSRTLAQRASTLSFASSRHEITCWRETIGKILKELIDRIAALQVINKILNGHTRPSKNKVLRSLSQDQF